MTGTHRDMKFAGRVVAVAIAMTLMASPAWAQTIGSPRPERLQIEKSMKAIVAAQVEQDRAPRLQTKTVLPGAWGRKRSPTGTRVVVSALGALGGFFAGGFLGAKLEPDCNCDDPGLQGFVIGAPIGAIAGGILGWKLSGR